MPRHGQPRSLFGRPLPIQPPIPLRARTCASATCVFHCCILMPALCACVEYVRRRAVRAYVHTPARAYVRTHASACVLMCMGTYVRALRACVLRCNGLLVRASARTYVTHVQAYGGLCAHAHPTITLRTHVRAGYVRKWARAYTQNLRQVWTCARTLARTSRFEARHGETARTHEMNAHMTAEAETVKAIGTVRGPHTYVRTWNA